MTGPYNVPQIENRSETPVIIGWTSSEGEKTMELKGKTLLVNDIGFWIDCKDNLFLDSIDNKFTISFAPILDLI